MLLFAYFPYFTLAFGLLLSVGIVVYFYMFSLVLPKSKVKQRNAK